MSTRPLGSDREQQLEVIRLADALVTQHGIERTRALRQAERHLGVTYSECIETPEQRALVDARDEKRIVYEADKQMRSLLFTVWNLSQPRASKIACGIPDRLYTHAGRGVALFWEAKTKHGTQRPDQRVFQEQMDACGFPYVLGTDEVLYTWLIEHKIACEEGGLLVPLPYERTERSA